MMLIFGALKTEKTYFPEPPQRIIMKTIWELRNWSIKKRLKDLTYIYWKSVDFERIKLQLLSELRDITGDLEKMVVIKMVLDLGEEGSWKNS